MNTLTQTRGLHVSLIDRIAHRFAALRERMHKNRICRQTMNELYALSDRELNDLGIHPSMIPTIAREAAEAA